MTSTINSTLSVSFLTQKTETTSDPTATAPAISMNLQTAQPSAFTKNYTATSTIDGQEAWSGHVTLSSGAATLDLTALTQVGLATTVNATGMKLRAIQVLADAANANPISVGTGGTNGYDQVGVLSNIKAGDLETRISNSVTAIDGTHKTLDIAGTGSQGCTIHMVFGVN
jgi:hypothetical protein